MNNKLIDIEDKERGLLDGFKMNLQMFADGGSNPTPDQNKEDEGNDDGDKNNNINKNPNNDEDNNSNSGAGVKGDNKTQNLKDLLGEDDKLGEQFQDEINNAIQLAIKKRDEEHAAELAEKERLSKLTAEELQAEKAKQLEEKERQIQQYELKLNINEYCRNNNIDQNLAELIHIESKNEIESKFNVLSQHINNVVNAKVEERLKDNGYNPNPGDKEKPGGQKKFSEEEIMRMSPEEINKYWDMI